MSTSSTLPTKTSASSWLWNSCHRTFPKDLLLVPILLEFSSLFASRVVVPSRFLSFRLLFNCHRSRRLCSWGFDEATRQVPLMTQHNRCRWVHRCFKVLSHIPIIPQAPGFQHLSALLCGVMRYAVRSPRATLHDEDAAVLGATVGSSCFMHSLGYLSSQTPHV